MRQEIAKSKAGLIVILLLAGAVSTGTALQAQKKPKLKPDELVALHLNALGSAQAREARGNCLAKGTGKLVVLVGNERMIPGEASFACEGRQFSSSIVFEVSDYPAEIVSFDGQKTYVVQLQPGRRSEIGRFLYQYPALLKEGLIGGTLSTAWPLLELESRRPRLKYNGLKKLYNQDLHELGYRIRRGGSDLKIALYFAPESYLHLATIAQVTIPAALNAIPSRSLSGSARAADSPRQVATQMTLEERFGDFREVDGLALPFRWIVRLHTTGPGAREGLFSGATQDRSILQWDVQFDTITHNTSLDPAIFAPY